MRLRRGKSLKYIIVSFLVTTLIIFYGQFESYISENKRTLDAHHDLHKVVVIQEIVNHAVEAETDEMNQHQQACIQPTLDINDPVMVAFLKRLPPVVCTGTPNWVFVQNGTLRFSEEAKKSHPTMRCNYSPLIRGPGDDKFSFGQAHTDVNDSFPLVSDFFKVSCKDKNKATYTNIHAGIHINQTIQQRLSSTKPPSNGLGLSIAVLSFDSMSRMSWLRRMPLTRNYLVQELQAIELQGFNILGDGTPAAIIPLLTGKHEQELPDTRKITKGAQFLDNFPWLWKNFSQHGYVTSWADAHPEISPFNYRLRGFEHVPTDLYMRPYYLAVRPLYRKKAIDCQGSVPRHKIWFDWIRDIFLMYKNDFKFLVHHYTPLSHDDNNKITMADGDLKEFLQHLETGGYLNKTLLVVMADHGARFATVRSTLSGKLEERLPYASFRFPPWFEKKYPDLIKNVRTNVHRLTTVFDFHETFKDFLLFDGAGLGDTKNRGISLFKEIPKSRTCEHADVAPHWCSCLAWKDVSHDEPDAKKALQTALDVLNNFTESYRSDCALLTIGNVTNLSKLITDDHLLKFKKTKGDRGLEPILDDNFTPVDKVMFQLTFFTEPGHGEFEITLEHDLKTDSMTVDPKAISRINKYGDAPACILDKNREIRQYCYCRK